MAAINQTLDATRYCKVVEPALPPLYQLGIVGSGQIARLTHQAALKLGMTPKLMAEHMEDSAAQVAREAVFSHPDALSSFSEYCGVLTFESDHMDIGLLSALEESGATIRPGSKAMRAAFDKIYQRRILLNRGFPVPAFTEVRGPDDIFDFASMFAFPMVLKSVRAVKRGDRGVWILENQSEALKVLSEQQDYDLMVENFQAIVKELVVLVARRPGGNIRCYPVAEVTNEDGACTEIQAPAEIGTKIATEARELAIRLAEELDGVGILAVELFLTADGLVVNEIAARPHNAGHITIEGCTASQFENHVRAVLDLPLGPTWLNVPAVATVNVIGSVDGVDPANHLAEALAVEGASVHLYGKLPAPRIKLGHVTAVGDNVEQARELAHRAEAALSGRRP